MHMPNMTAERDYRMSLAVFTSDAENRKLGSVVYVAAMYLNHVFAIPRR